MVIYQITKDKLPPLAVTKFGTEGLYAAWYWVGTSSVAQFIVVHT
jgi:hypothetical protein